MDNNLISLIQGAGIVGAGGAGFPTHVKVKAKAEYVIVNGAECEPLLRVDQQLMYYKAEEMIIGLKAVVQETGAKKGIIALKKKYHAAIEKLEKLTKDDETIEVFTLGDFYPAGDEQITVYEVLNRIVPEGGIPLQVGVVVINVETLINVYYAKKGLPVTEKYVTVTGEVNKPVTLKVPLGVSINEMIQLAGGPTVAEFEIVDGGPMMGKLVEDIHSPITKTTKGLIVLPKEHPLVKGKRKSIEATLREAKTACCHCSLCTEVCPRNLIGHKLHPDKLMRIASYNSTCENNSSVTEAFLCCECGLCELACIMDLQPWKLNSFLKGRLSAAGIKNDNNRKPEEVNQFRGYRKFPVKKLIARLSLEKYNVDAPLIESVDETVKGVVLSQKQHIGAMAQPLVQVGDVVKKGDPVANVNDGQLGAMIHASISGTVKSINQKGIEISS
ncbi:SLBB domain-containing protein [Alkalicella caledoniensis]|uniref:SLBB domain-containing protein n=1 Tax=Alkalicella caledoniensis TaxID=2731377 RepID=A0A7G9W5N5_ALKCA|nr:4Fe-4S dicluster domain-containing protein [Alkalicella caledoniensis]QNO13997.1 SLBB domain-containing protein [Alkalicella caledoniensis]